MSLLLIIPVHWRECRWWTKGKQGGRWPGGELQAPRPSAIEAPLVAMAGEFKVGFQYSMGHSRRPHDLEIRDETR